MEWAMANYLKKAFMRALGPREAPSEPPQERFDAPVITRQIGAKMRSILLADPVAVDWYSSGMEQPAEIDELKRGRLRPGSLVFDIGAHQAVIAMMLADEVGPNGKVIALEAHPHNARVARANVANNDMLQITVHNMAVSNNLAQRNVIRRSSATRA
jgi:tRNA A58 N-methylase Trm61